MAFEQPAANPEPAEAETGQSWITVAAGGVVGFSVLIAGIALARSRRRTKSGASAEAPQPHSEPASSGNGSAAPKMPSLHPHKMRARVATPSRQPAAPALKPRVNGSARGNNGSKRKRAFDYNRYFADLMSSVSSYSLATEHTLANGNAHPATQESMPAKAAEQPAFPVLDANAQMIANQKNLIEDQRRLIQEQTRLIEEKTRLISEKNHLLKMQSEMIGDKIL